MEIGSMLLDRYEILDVVGIGGMATVYKAKCHILDRLVAIKELKKEYADDEEFVKKFQHECLAAAKLNYPNIVGIYDFRDVEDEDGRKNYYIIMEYIDGKTLKDIISEKGKLSEEEALVISTQVLAALQEAHKNGVIHRDIKPHNIMITGNGIVKVTDFGIARATTSHTMTTTMDAIGSVHYFSPEQARGAFTDQRTDIYSFGITLYEMVTGKRPFTGENPVTVAMKHIEEDIIPPSEINPEISESMENIILKCTQKKQTERYQNVGEIIHDIETLLNNKRSFVSSEEIDEQLDRTRIIPREEIDEVLKNKPSLADAYDNSVDKPKKKKPLIFSKKRVEDDYDDEDDDDYYDEDDYYDDYDDDDYDDDYNYNEKHSGRAKGILQMVLGILAALVITTGLYIGFTKIKDHNESNKIVEIKAPNIVGMSVEDARAELAQYKINLEVERTIHETTREYGIIIQRPQEGIDIKEGSTIYVTVNEPSGKEDVTTTGKFIGDYVGKKLKDVGDEVAKLGIGYTFEYDENSDKPNDEILAQSPKAGTEITEDTVLVLTISGADGLNNLVKIPKLVGLNIEDAKALLTSNNLAVGQISYEKSEEAEKDVVIAQSHEEGVEFTTGTFVSLTVSSGTEEVEENKEGEEENNTEENNENTENNATQENNENKDNNANNEAQSELTDFAISFTVPDDKPETHVQIYNDVDGVKTLIYDYVYSADKGVEFLTINGLKVGSIIELYFDGQAKQQLIVNARDN